MKRSGMSIFTLWGRRMLRTSLWRWRNRRRADSFYSGSYNPHMDCVSGRVGEMEEWSRRLYKDQNRKGSVVGVISFFRFYAGLMPDECHAHKLESLCCVLSGLTASWCNLTQLTCACGRPACRTGWSPGLGSKLTGLITGLGFPVWKTLSESGEFLWWCWLPSGLLFRHHCWSYRTSILVCLLRYGTALLSSSFYSSCFCWIFFSLVQRFSLWCLCGVILALQNR